MRDEAFTQTALEPASGRTVGSDPHDFAGLYVRHRSSFTSHARRYLRDPRDADEVVQEAFLRLFLALPELETELQALAYCRRTITNLCIDRYRADARRPRLVALEGQTVDELADADTGDPVVRAEDAALVREALSRLPELHRAALVKREVEEKPLPVIAAELDVAEDSVKHLLFRARRALRTLLAGTAVAPGADLERARRLRPVASGASGGLAGLLVLALIVLGSGPDLRAVPVVGVDLPDVLGVTAVVDAVSEAVGGAVEVLVPGERAEAAVQPQDPGRAAPGQPSVGGGAATSDEVAGAASTSPATAARSVGQDSAVQRDPAVRERSAPVTGVDGRPAVTAVPPGAPLQAAVPVAGVRPADGRGRSTPTRVPVISDDRGPAPAVAGPAPAVGERPVVTAPPAGPAAGQPVPRADAQAPAVADRAAEKAERGMERAAEQVQKAAEKHAAEAERAAEKAAEQVQKAAEKQAAAADRAAEKAERAAARAAAEQQEAVETAAAEVPPVPVPAVVTTP